MENQINQNQIKLDPDTFLEGAEESKEFNEITEIIRNESQKYIKEAKSKQAEDWKILANQTVGYEKF